VEFRHDGRIVATVLLASGGGSQRWSALEVRLAAAVAEIRAEVRPTYAIVGGAQGIQPRDVTPPLDVISGDAEGDIIEGPQLKMLAVDELRTNPEALPQLAA
jgi:hypothetical protein